MNILFISSEAAPIVKVGGLGDVIGSLPPALRKEGADVRVALPYYRDVKKHNPDLTLRETARLEVPIRNKKYTITVYETALPGSDTPAYLLYNETFLSNSAHEAIYDGEGGSKRFLFFSQAVMSLMAWLEGSWEIDLAHLHDWHSGFIPLAMDQAHLARRPKTLLTIHNLGYQGLVSPSLMFSFGFHIEDRDIITQRKFFFLKRRFVSMLREGIKYADAVGTVSPTYAKEILTSEYGAGMDEILQSRQPIAGILNGIDVDYWDPSRDGKIYASYDAPEGKRENKERLMAEVGLDPVEHPLMAFVGRLDPNQKGVDVFHDSLSELLPDVDASFVVLGTGDKKWEKQLASLARKYKGKMAFIGAFDEALAHKIYAAADGIVVPSKYEPCGLIQMIGMRYGAVPIVRKTGGLADSVIDGVDGFVFEKYDAHALAEALKRAIRVYADKEAWGSMARKAMEKDFSWDASAKQYLELYRKIMHNG